MDVDDDIIEVVNIYDGSSRVRRAIWSPMVSLLLIMTIAVLIASLVAARGMCKTRRYAWLGLQKHVLNGHP